MWTIQATYEKSRAAAHADADMQKKNAEIFVKILIDNGLTRPEIADKIGKLNRERLQAVPDLKKYPELRGMGELIDAEWRGLRDGAGLDDAAWAATCDALHYLHRYVYGKASKKWPMKANCSYFFFPTSEYGPILANNLDVARDCPYPPPSWPAISEHLILGRVSSGVYMDEQSPEVFPVDVFKLVARYCRNTDEALEMLQRYNHFWGPTNIILIDRQLNVLMIEKTACRMGIRRSQDGFAYITAMTARDPSLKSYLDDRRAASIAARGLPPENADVAYWKAQDRRADLMRDLLEEARKAPSLEKMRQCIQFRSKDRGVVCDNGEVYFPGGPESEYTVRTVIWRLRDGKALWWGLEGDKPSFENRKPDVDFKDVWLWS